MSLYANVDGVPARAAPGRSATCPHCEEPMRAKCGRIVVWHWAHLAGVSCDPWSEGETRWHLESKLDLARRGCLIEQRITINGKWHVADAVTPSGTVIELQHSSIGVADISAREQHYGQRMVWIFHAERWLPRIHEGARGFWWKNGAKSQTFCQRPVLWDCRPPVNSIPLARLDRHISMSGIPRVALNLVEHEVVDWYGDDTHTRQRVLGTVMARFPNLAAVAMFADERLTPAGVSADLVNLLRKPT